MKHITYAFFALFITFTSFSATASAIMMPNPVLDCPTINKSLYRGLRDVRAGGPIGQLQRYLAAQGYMQYDSITGYYGKGTERAVRIFQLDNGLQGLGNVGPRTRALIVSRCGGITPPVCPVYQMAYPVCPNNQTPVKSQDSRGCVTGYSCPNPTSYRAPVISSFSGPTTLAVNTQGTWSTSAYDPDGTYLTYSVDWGDTPSYAYSSAVSPSVTQQATVTHSYNIAGTYIVRVTVTDVNGMTAESTATVVVGGGTAYGLQVTYPNVGGNFTTGSTLPIAWSDTAYSSGNTYTLTLEARNGTSYTTQIVSPVYGGSYSWVIPTTVPSGVYIVRVCKIGFAQCDESDAVFSITQSGSNPTVSFAMNPVSGTAPLTATASITVVPVIGGVSGCGTLTLGTLEWGDGTSENMQYMGCSGTQTLSRSHTYASAGTYVARLTNNGAVLGTQTIVATGASAVITNVTTSTSTIRRGETMTISYTIANAPTDARVRLELRDANGGTVGASGVVAGLSPVSGSYVWSVPQANIPCAIDSGNLCSSDIVDGRQYIVRAVVYTPSSACWGYCNNQYNPTILASRDSAVFTINGSTVSGKTISAVNDGVAGYPYNVTVTTNTQTSGLYCSVQNIALDFGDGQSQMIYAGSTGGSYCGNAVNSYVHRYTSAGTYNLVLRNVFYPYEVIGTETITVY